MKTSGRRREYRRNSRRGDEGENWRLPTVPEVFPVADAKSACDATSGKHFNAWEPLGDGTSART